MKRLHSAGTAAFVVATAMASVPAWAQAPSASTDDIIVTAQKRSESAQKVPAAITAITGDDLKVRAIAKLEDVQYIAPSMTVANSGVTQSVNIRGVGLASGNASASNGVATYIDGMFQPPVVTTTSFYDLASVEVFRGPQGTFVGSNSTGGAVFVNSRNPDVNGVNGYAEVSMGSYNRAGAEGAVNIPISSTLAARGAFYYAKRDSYFTSNTGRASNPGSLDEVAGRIGVLWTPNEHFNALLKTEANTKKTGGYAWQPGPQTPYAAFGNADPYVLSFSDETYNNEKNLQTTLKMDFVTDNGITFRSVTGYTQKRVKNFDDTDGTNAPTLPRLGRKWNINEREKTEEINIISPDDQKLKWVVGGYYQQNVIDVYIDDSRDTVPFLNILLRPTKTTKGAFGQVTVPLGDRLSVDIGARKSWYNVDAFGYVKLAANGLQVGDTGGHERDSKLTGKVAFNFQADEDNLFYAFVARGYKAGGYQTPLRTFRPETVYDYEAGWKSAFLDRHVKTQIGAFYYDYTDFQLDAIDQGSGLNAVFNIGDATIKGAEAQIQANMSGFLFDAGAAYVDSTLSAGQRLIDTRLYTLGSNLPQCTSPGVPTGCVDYSPYLITTTEGPNLYSPKWSGNVSLGYEFQAGDFTITPRVNYSYVGSQFTYVAYNPVRDFIPSRGLVSASTTVDLHNLELQLYATNLTDEVYVTGRTNTNQYVGAPREYGVRLKASF